MFFFFSSRRRHTRSLCDWSSDVCSSDLPTAVINTSACGVIETARRHKNDIGTVLIGKNGIIGALQEELIDTQFESDEAIAGLRHTPASAFGTCRYKLKSIEENKTQYERLIEVFAAHDIGYFFY